MIYKSRIKRPAVRKSYLENPDNPKPELRGKDEWVEVPYEEAIKLVARELKKTIKSLFFFLTLRFFAILSLTAKLISLLSAFFNTSIRVFCSSFKLSMSSYK